jgi:hypothetical protein
MTSERRFTSTGVYRFKYHTDMNARSALHTVVAERRPFELLGHDLRKTFINEIRQQTNREEGGKETWKSTIHVGIPESPLAIMGKLS